MIDYWEAIGRLASDKKLADGLEKILPAPGEYPYSPTIRENQVFGGLDIPKHLYDAVQAYLEPVLSQQYLSLTAAGELLWAYSYKEVRNFIGVLNGILSTGAHPKVEAPSASYFIALGLLVNDKGFREKVRDGHADSIKRLRNLKPGHLENLMSVIKNPTFESSVKSDIDFFWMKGCQSTLIVSKDYIFTPGIKALPGALASKAAGAAGYK